MEEFKNVMKMGVLAACLVAFNLLNACVPIIHSRHTAWFKNVTGDTLLVGVSCFDNIDSVFWFVEPASNMCSVKDSDLFADSLTKELKFQLNQLVYPDSMCYTSEESMFMHDDTCYFFLFKFRDINHNSWKEICAKKLYHKWMVVRDRDGNFDRDIKYKDE